jgi:hypothetical protein
MQKDAINGNPFASYITFAALSLCASMVKYGIG